MEVKEYTYAELEEIRLRINPGAYNRVFMYNHCQLHIERGEYKTVNILDDDGKVKYSFTNAKPFDDKRPPNELHHTQSNLHHLDKR